MTEPHRKTPVATVFDKEPNRPIPVMRPLLPSADRLMPYLRRIDAARNYANFGPLTIELQNRLARHFNAPEGAVACASSGTAALIGAILAASGPASLKRPYALMPAFTFAATAIAAERCGYRPHLADIDSAVWAMDPARLADHPLIGRIGVVLAVAPFGRPVPAGPWRDFQSRTGCPVVIDAAASFDCLGRSPSLFLQDAPVILSFHATKSFATGEGGCVISTNDELAARAGQSLNFGFHMSRDSAVPSLNGKMSEYHAAVGLAELDGWDAKHEAFRRALEIYGSSLSNIGLIERFVAWPEISACYALFHCANESEAARVKAELRQASVDFRFWYGDGLHRQTQFCRCSRDSLEVTEALAPALIGLPMAPDLTEHEVSRCAEALKRAYDA